MKKAMASLFISAVALLLAGYSALRTLDFVQLTLPPDQQAAGFLALLATEGGVLCWLVYFLWGAEGGWQKAIALVMVVVDLVGSTAMFSADTLLQAGRAGMAAELTPGETRSVVVALSAAIAVNIAATVLCHLFDPEARRRQAEGEAFGEVEEAALSQIRQNARQLAAELAPVLAEDWMRQTRARYLAGLGAAGGQVLEAQVRPAKSEDNQPSKADEAAREAREPEAVPFGSNGNGRH